MLGRKSLRTALHYIKILNTKIDNDIRIMKAKL